MAKYKIDTDKGSYIVETADPVPGMEQLGGSAPAPAAAPLPWKLEDPNRGAPPESMMDNDSSYLGTAAHLLASPITGLLGIPGQVDEWARGKRTPSGGFLSEEPITQAYGNLLMAGQAGYAQEPKVAGAAKVVPPTTGGGLMGGVKGAAKAFRLSKSAGPGMLGYVGGRALGTAMGIPYLEYLGAAAANAPEIWRSFVKGAKGEPVPEPTSFERAKAQFQGPRTMPPPPGSPPTPETPEPVTRRGFGSSSAPRQDIKAKTSYPGPLETKKVGGFGRGRIPRQNVDVTATLNPEELTPEPIDLPEKMGPPPVSPPPPPSFETKRVGGFGTAAIPRGRITPTVTDMTPPPQVDLPPEISGPRPVQPVQPPQSVDISGAPREAAPVQPSSPAPVYGSEEWLQNFKAMYPDLPPPVIDPVAAAKAKLAAGQLTAADIQALKDQAPGKATAPQTTKPMTPAPAAAQEFTAPPAPSKALLNTAANEMYGSDYDALNPQAKANLDSFVEAHSRVPTVDDVQSGAFNKFGRTAKPTAPVQATGNPMENPPKPKETTTKPAEPETKAEPTLEDRIKDLPPRYQQMARDFKEEQARAAYAKDTKIAQHLINQKPSVTPEMWDKMSWEDQQKLAKEGHAVKGSPGLEKRGSYSRPREMGIADVRQRLVDLRQGMPPEPKATAQPPAKPTTPPPPAKQADKPLTPPPPPKPVAQAGAADPGHVKVARWLRDEREITPEYWKKISDEEKKAYILLAGEKIAKGTTAFDAQDVGIAKQLQQLRK